MGTSHCFLAVNKVETEALAAEAENFRRLGIRNVYAVSSEHGLGIGELLDAIAGALPEKEHRSETASPQAGEEIEQAIEDEIEEGGPLSPGEETDDEPGEELDEEDIAATGEEPAEEAEGGKRRLRTHGEYEQRETSIAIIGKPNVGKSTLLNALTGTTRAIVSPIAGTTRDAVDEVVEFEGNTLRFVDTAGIRRKGKTKLMAEKLSVVMARRHLEAADVALLLIDATEGVTASDATIGGYAHESGRSVIVIVNKWDLVTTGRTDGKPPADRMIFEQQLRKSLKYLDYAPVIFFVGA